MTEKDLKDTKNRILNVAEELFAKSGYSGTSIREIASKADVNLSAVNYHFKNKQTLYWQVFESSYQWLANGIIEAGQGENIDTRELSWRTHRFLLDNGHHLLNMFTMFLSEDIPKPDGTFEAACRNDEDGHGPPGQQVFLAKITKEVGENIPFDGRHWAMRNIFSNIMQFSLKLSAPLFKEELKCEKYLQPEEMKRSIYFMVEATLQYLKNNPKNWS